MDPDNRELFISLGCALENACIAATHKGYRTDVSIGENHVIRIDLTGDRSVLPDTLFYQIPLRQTNRSVYNGKRIPREIIEALQATGDDPDIPIRFFENGSSPFDTIAAYVVRGNTLQMRDKAFTGELHQWMRYNKKHQDRTNDGLSYAVFGAPDLPLFLIKPVMKRAINEKSQNKGDKQKMVSSSHFVLFTTRGNTVREWIALGRILQRFLLETNGLGIAHAYLNQPNEVGELSREMAESLGLQGEYPTILLRTGYGETMPYSKRKPVTEVIIQ